MNGTAIQRFNIVCEYIHDLTDEGWEKMKAAIHELETASVKGDDDDEPEPSSNDLVCIFCDATTESVVAAIKSGWIPSFFVGDTRQDGPVCVECCAKCLSTDERGKVALKPEFAVGQYVRVQGGREFKSHCVVNTATRALVIHTAGTLPGRLAEEYVVVDGGKHPVCPCRLRDNYTADEQAQMFFWK